MDVVVLIQVLINTLVLSALYALVAIGLSLVFSIMRIVNFAHAQMYVLGAFGFYYLYQLVGIPWWLAAVLSALGVALAAVILEALLIRPLHGDPLRSMIVTLGLLLVMNGAMVSAFGSDEKFVSPAVSGAVDLGVTSIALQKVVAVGVAIALVTALFMCLKWTRPGRAMRAVAEDAVGARLQGIGVHRINALGFSVGSGLAALAGGLILPLTSSVSPAVGDGILPKMFIIVIVGGLGSVGGAVAGALTLAAIETIGFTYLGEIANLFIYLLVLAVLLVRPEGFFARA
ncbi:MAG: branched-chain amino acid transport system permease protein [Pseudonocardiales bacterium]|nr:branched-chain amino acid transport system permease protein [Pseudonocardiales bacterium]